MEQKSERENSSAILTAGEIFPDGAVIELLRGTARAKELTLVRYHEGALDLNSGVTHAGRIFEPIRVDQSVSRSVRLPTRVAAPETAHELFTAVHTLLSSRLGQLDMCITAMVFAIFASWMSPVLPMAPLLSIFGPAGGPTNLVLQMLSLLCRRPLRLVGLRRGDIPRLPMSLQPTLLLDEPDLGPEMQVMLQSSTQRGTRLISSRGIQDFYGPKIVCSRKPSHGTALETDALRVALIPMAGQLPPLNKKEEEEVAEEFQARFLGYLLRNSSGVQIPSFDVSQFSLPVQDLARTFGAAVVGNIELQKRILPLLSVQDEEIRADRARAHDAVVLEAGLFFIHQGGWSKVRTDDIAEKVGAIYKGRGSDQQPSPETVGRVIRRLGIPSGRINRAGNGVELGVSTCRLIHKLAQSHGVRAMQFGIPSDCRYCRELDPMTTKL